MKGVALAMAMAILLGAAPGRAFDAMGADIIGLRLGMNEAEAVATLRLQGFAITHDHGHLLARTRDGQLTVALNADQAVQEVRYIFGAHGAGEPDKIGASISDRFGPPDQARPMAWCRTVGRDGICPKDAALLTFLPDSLTLILKAATPEPPAGPP